MSNDELWLIRTLPRPRVSGRALSCFVHAALVAVLSLVGSRIEAASLDIAYGGTDGSHVLWDVNLAPDATPGVALEIGFTFSGGQILEIEPNDAVFAFLNPGENPFTGTVTEGVSIHNGAAVGDSAFAALGGILTSATPVRVLTIATEGPGTLSLGGHDHNGLFTGARVAQGAGSQDELTASLAIDFLAADFNRDLQVDGADLAIWASAFGGSATGTSGDADGDGFATGSDLLTWQRQFGQNGAPSTATAAAVPEPPALALVILGLVVSGCVRCGRHAVVRGD